MPKPPQIPKAFRDVRVEDYERRLARLEEVVGRQNSEITELRSVVFPAPLPVLDDFDQWVTSKDAEQHAGKFVAFVPGEGPIVISTSRRELMDEVKKHRHGKLARIGFVPCLTDAR